MNAALERTIYDLAYTMAIDLAFEAYVAGNADGYESWKSTAIEIALEYVKVFDERPSLI